MGMLLSVGQPLPGHKNQGAEGVSFEPTMIGSPMVLVQFDRPNPQEIAAFPTTPMWLALHRVNEHTSFLLLKASDVIYPEWGDAPFSACVQSDPRLRTLKREDPNAGWAVTVLLIDRTTGIIHGMRTPTASPEFSQVLEELLNEQEAAIDTFTMEKHLRTIQETYRRYPGSADLLPGAEIVTPIGVKFGEADRLRRSKRAFPARRTVEP
jgi:hypothetical protein